MEEVIRYRCEICKMIYDTAAEAMECESIGGPVNDDLEDVTIGNFLAFQVEHKLFGDRWVYSSEFGEVIFKFIIPENDPYGNIIHQWALLFRMQDRTERIAIMMDTDMGRVLQSQVEMVYKPGFVEHLKSIHGG